MANIYPVPTPAKPAEYFALLVMRFYPKKDIHVHGIYRSVDDAVSAAKNLVGEGFTLEPVNSEETRFDLRIRHTATRAYNTSTRLSIQASVIS